MRYFYSQDTAGAARRSSLGEDVPGVPGAPPAHQRGRRRRICVVVEGEEEEEEDGETRPVEDDAGDLVEESRGRRGPASLSSVPE